VLPFEQQYLDALPCAQMYEKSYMHRDTVTHVVVSMLAVQQAYAAQQQRRQFLQRCQHSLWQLLLM
jgi:hypothetical protein